VNQTKNPTKDLPSLPKNPREGQTPDISLAKNNVCTAEDTKKGKLNPGSLTIKVVGNLDRSSQVKMFRIWPSPYTSINSLVLSDNDNSFDCDQRTNVLSLDHVPFKEYKINAIDQVNGKPLLNFNFSINQDLANPVITIVKRDLGTPLPIRLVPDQHLLILTTTVNDPGQVANDISSRYKVKILKIYGGEINGILVRVPEPKILDEIMKDPRIAYREQDKIGIISSVEGQVLPKGIDRIGGDLYQPARIGLTNNSINLESDGNDAFSRRVDVDVAILDTGISFEHPDLNVYRNVSFVNYTTVGDDDQGHGSHVAGIVAAKNNSFGVVGLAPGARLWAVKVCDQTGICTTSNQIRGVEYVINHADEIDVANISIENLYSPALNTAIKRAVLKGVTFVVSSGNSHQNASKISPANSPFAITVSAMADTDGMCGGYGPSTEFGKDDNFANFSNFGRVVDVAAPV
jgi:subtilisin family serine protease